jgi:hypothetical protein
MSDAQPGYDFYAAAPSAAPEPSPFGTVNAFGTPAPFGTAEPAGMPATSRPPFLSTVTPPRTPTPRWVTVMIVGICAGYVAVIGLSVAIPVFLAQRAKARLAATTVQVPEVFQGTDRRTNRDLDALAGSARLDGYGAVQAGLFPAGRNRGVMIVAARSGDALLAEPAQATARRQLVDGLAAEPLSGAVGDGDVWLGCAPASGGGTVCVSTDATALVAVIAGNGVEDPQAVTRSARAATVHRV